jgi:PadR family transcriptional regulator, regulatory protein PadR
MALREPTLFTLAALREGPLHGYAIITRVRELSAGRIELTAGTLYGALDRLVGQGLVVVDGEEVVDGRRRRYHRLTDAGQVEVAQDLARLRATVDALDPGGRGVRASHGELGGAVA